MPSKICLIHDMFLYRGGAERFNVMLVRAIWADLSALFFSPEALDPRSLGFSGEIIPFGENRFEKGRRQLYLKWQLLFYTRFLRDYDTVIFSNDTLSAIGNVKKWARKIYYAHSIPRYLFDQKEFYYHKVPFLLRPAYVVARAFFTRMYLSELRKVDTIYVNSRNLQVAMKEYLGRESEIIHPPVDTSLFSPLKEIPQEVQELGEYYVSFSKLSSLKRVARTVEAFREMPDKKLLVIYGKNDPQKDEIMKLGAWYPNIIFLTLIDNNDLPKYVAGAIATIFIARNEDFGMVALESMACGVPVIGVDEGGIKETVLDGVTGILIGSEALKDELIAAVQKMDRITSLDMKEDCLKHAEKFSLKRFEKIVQVKMM